MNSSENNTIEIDVLDLLKKLWQKKALIIFAAVFCGMLALLGSVFIIRPTYTSSTRIYVVNQTTANNITTQDLQAGSYLVNDYKEIITSDSVVNEVIQKEGLALTVQKLHSMISVSIPSDTRIITISVNSNDPQEAQRLANSLREVAAEKIKAVTKVEDVTTIEEAKLPEFPSSPNIRRNAILGFLAGGFLAVMVILLVEVLDDRVRRPEDIEDVMGLVLLGVVPDTDKM